MSRFLIVTWDGAGNLVPTLGIARRLGATGHDVRVLGQRSIVSRYKPDGWTFVPFASAPAFDPVSSSVDSPAAFQFLLENVIFGPDVARDTLSEIKRESADAVIVDAMLATALCAAESARVRTAALIHTLYAFARDPGIASMTSFAIPGLNALRHEFGLDPVRGVLELQDRSDLALVSSFLEFEEERDTPPNVRFVGPVIDAPPMRGGVMEPTFDGEHADDPLVLVSFSTSHMGQIDLLQRVLDALSDAPARVLLTTGPAVEPERLRAPHNARIERYVAHSSVLPHASAVVTHAGLGTVMASLSQGVPLICIPMGRDQPLNSQRVEAVGAGLALPMDADAKSIAAAVNSVLGDSRFRAGAQKMAAAIATYGGSAAAVTELERLAGASP